MTRNGFKVICTIYIPPMMECEVSISDLHIIRFWIHWKKNGLRYSLVRYVSECEITLSKLNLGLADYAVGFMEFEYQ